jgi:hypothetical protein
MLILPDNDVTGAVKVLERLIELDWPEYSSLIGLQFTTFEELGLSRNARDITVWQTCQAAKAVLITANRSGHGDSLDKVIRQLSDSESLPVITIGNPQRVLNEKSYAELATIGLLDYLERIETLRGTGRLFIP